MSNAPLADFYARLDACNLASLSERAALEADLWARFGTEKTVLILDMAGFTTKVQKHGLLFFLRKIRYMQSVVAPLLAEWRGELVKFEADNAYAVFTRPLDAVHCALHIHEKFQYLADGLPDVDDVVVSIGLAHGRIMLIPGHDFFGDAVNIASRLGEDIAGHRETYVSAELFAYIANDPELAVEPVQGLGMTAGKVARRSSGHDSVSQS
ncbi:MAG: adenylate/guanylate cyclase domain-containing protein [Opitutaceae bacterium]|nr:adenylate/guanylate cyclase domain-containing protein [Opitutaceae bacterium]